MELDQNQYEERTNKRIGNIDRYITAIYTTKSGLKIIKNEHPDIFEKHKDRFKII